MNTQFDWRAANKYLPHILGIGIIIGGANYSLGSDANLGQTIVTQSITSFCIGYPLLLVIFNQKLLGARIKQKIFYYLILSILFLLIGILGSEIEMLARSFLFTSGTYHPFSGGGIYVFNSLLSLALGFSMLSTIVLMRGQETTENTNIKLPQEAITTIPVKKGEHVLLKPVDEIIFFEAFDMYAYLQDLEGNRMLCDFSLGTLDKKLGNHFARVHRKYIVNRNHIAQISPFAKGRYSIVFKDKNKSSITSSASYTELIKSWIKL